MGQIDEWAFMPGGVQGIIGDPAAGQADALEQRDSSGQRVLRRLFLLLIAFAFVPALANGQAAVGNGPAPVPPLNANLYGVLPSPFSADNSPAMQNAIIAAAAMGASVVIPSCGTYEFEFPNDSASLCSGSPIWGPAQLGAGQTIVFGTLGIPLVTGISYALSAPPGTTIVLTWQRDAPSFPVANSLPSAGGMGLGRLQRAHRPGIAATGYYHRRPHLDGSPFALGKVSYSEH